MTKELPELRIRKSAGCAGVLTSLLCLILGGSGPALSETTPAQKNSAQASEPPAKAEMLQTEVALKNMRDGFRRLHRVALDLIDEVEQRDMVVVGTEMTIQPIPEKKDPDPGQMEEMVALGNALPPRKKWLDATMADCERTMSLLKEDKGAIDIPQDKQAETAAPLAEFNSVMDDISKHYANLKNLTMGPKYDNLAIGKEALGIYNDTAKIEKPWKEILRSIRK